MVHATASKTNGHARPRKNGKAAHPVTDTTDPRNMEMGGNATVGQGEGFEHGCPARIGAKVYDGQGPEGTIIGFTDQLVIYEDENGRHGAQTFGMCTTPLAPPVDGSALDGANDSTAQRGPHSLFSMLGDPRLQTMRRKIVQLIVEAASIAADQEGFTDDYAVLIEHLQDAELKASEIEDNRIMRMVDAACIEASGGRLSGVRRSSGRDA